MPLREEKKWTILNIKYFNVCLVEVIPVNELV